VKPLALPIPTAKSVSIRVNPWQKNAVLAIRRVGTVFVPTRTIGASDPACAGKRLRRAGQVSPACATNPETVAHPTAESVSIRVHPC